MHPEEGFASFYAAHHAETWAYLVRLGATSSVASDLTQDTFVRWLERDAAKVGDNPRAYLYRIALHLYIDHVRRSRREIAWDAVPEIAAPDTDTPMILPQRAWGRLTLRQRQLLWLAYAEGFSHDEIADITGLGSGSIRVLLSRARARFQALQEERDEG